MRYARPDVHMSRLEEPLGFDVDPAWFGKRADESVWRFIKARALEAMESVPGESAAEALERVSKAGAIPSRMLGLRYYDENGAIVERPMDSEFYPETGDSVSWQATSESWNYRRHFFYIMDAGDFAIVAKRCTQDYNSANQNGKDSTRPVDFGRTSFGLVLVILGFGHILLCSGSGPNSGELKLVNEIFTPAAFGDHEILFKSRCIVRQRILSALWIYDPDRNMGLGASTRLRVFDLTLEEHGIETIVLPRIEDVWRGPRAGAIQVLQDNHVQEIAAARLADKDRQQRYTHGGSGVQLLMSAPAVAAERARIAARRSAYLGLLLEEVSLLRAQMAAAFEFRAQVGAGGDPAQLALQLVDLIKPGDFHDSVPQKVRSLIQAAPITAPVALPARLAQALEQHEAQQRNAADINGDEVARALSQVSESWPGEHTWFRNKREREARHNIARALRLLEVADAFTSGRLPRGFECSNAEFRAAVENILSGASYVHRLVPLSGLLAHHRVDSYNRWAAVPFVSHQLAVQAPDLVQTPLTAAQVVVAAGVDARAARVFVSARFEAARLRLQRAALRAIELGLTGAAVFDNAHAALGNYREWRTAAASDGASAMAVAASSSSNDALYEGVVTQALRERKLRAHSAQAQRDARHPDRRGAHTTGAVAKLASDRRTTDGSRFDNDADTVLARARAELEGEREQRLSPGAVVVSEEDIERARRHEPGCLAADREVAERAAAAGLAPRFDVDQIVARMRKHRKASGKGANWTAAETNIFRRARAEVMTLVAPLMRETAPQPGRAAAAGADAVASAPPRPHAEERKRKHFNAAEDAVLAQARADLWSERQKPPRAPTADEVLEAARFSLCALVPDIDVARRAFVQLGPQGYTLDSLKRHVRRLRAKQQCTAVAAAHE